MQLFLGDMVIVWRLYVVYGKNPYIAVLPALMCVGELCAYISAVRPPE